MTAHTQARYAGVFPVVPTIFDDKGGLDLEGQQRAVDFMIAEGEWVAYQFEVKAKNKVGGDYHNFYCLTFRCHDGKIAEIREHVDSMLSKEELFDPAGL